MYIRDYRTCDIIRPATESEVCTYLSLINARNHSGAVCGPDVADDLRLPDGTMRTVYMTLP